MDEEPRHFTIYTDGACELNPGPGGYGIVLIDGDVRKEFSGGFRQTTNNRMELYAAIQALETLKEPCKVTLHSDSEYVVNAMMQGWVKRWKGNNWRRRKQDRAVNSDLWETLFNFCEKHQVEFVWVKGHVGNPANERCDKLAHIALARTDLPIDEGYENRLQDEDLKAKITEEGQPCRKCSTPVIKKIPRKKVKRSRASYFEYYFYCPNCRTMYMVEEAKRSFDETPLL